MLVLHHAAFIEDKVMIISGSQGFMSLKCRYAALAGTRVVQNRDALDRESLNFEM